MPALDLKEAMDEFRLLKKNERVRNDEYYLLRQAVKGNFRWPRDWPAHIPKVTRNLCKVIVERHSTYLMSRGFNWNLDRPNSIEYRQAAERGEKILKRIFDLSASDLQFMEGAKSGSKVGRTIFKVYKKGKQGAEHACFSYCQPDYFYGVPVGPDSPGEFSVVYYSYELDVAEARRRYGNKDFKSEVEMAEADRYVPLREKVARADDLRSRRIPVVEVWTKDSYALVVGGITLYNGDSPDWAKWSDSGEGFIPFVVIENIRNDEEGYGEADIAQVRTLNERFNYLLSRRDHIVSRWLTPTVVWEGAPTNYAEVLADSMKGGGAIPARLGSRIYFLAYDRDNPAVVSQMQDLYQAMLDGSGMNGPALTGVVGGSINTGPSLSVQFQPLLSTVDKKRLEWTYGLERLCAMLLQVQESIGASTALGEAVVNTGGVKSENGMTGEVVTLSGADIAGLRQVTISWPGVLPKDDYQAARLELEKHQSGIQSVYTTMEKLGEEFPDDEIARIRMENEDPSLRGEKVAEQIRAASPLIRQQMQGDQQQNQQMAQMLMQMQAQQAQGAPPQGELPPGPGSQPSPLADRIRQANMGATAKVNTEGDFPVAEY